MPDVLTFVRRLRGSLRSSAFEASMEAELQAHLELEAELLVARGMDPREARLAARERFGSVAQIKDECRDSWGMPAAPSPHRTRQRRVRSRFSISPWLAGISATAIRSAAVSRWTAASTGSR
jgi:hypothetical protein